MTEATVRDAAQDALAITADTMGHDFLAALLQELRSMPDHWSRLNEAKQQQIIENLRVKIRTGIDKAVGIMLRSEFPAVQADVESVGFKGGIVASLKIPRDALFRHQLADATGTKVVVVIADPSRWLQRMDEIKATGDQIDLFDADYDPKRDQPGYRRDQDRIAPAGPTWDDLKKSLKDAGAASSQPEGETKPPEAGTDGAPGATGEEGGPLLFGSALDGEQEKRAAMVGLQELLAKVGVVLSLGAIQAFTPEQVLATSNWVQAYAENPDTCKIARPLWLPIPDSPPKEAE